MTQRSLRFVLLLALGAWPLLAADDPGPARSDTLSGLLDPAALRATRTPRTLAELRASFADPPAEFRPAPLWVWNDELDWPRLEEQLRQFAARGMGGVFVHPRPGLMTEYLGDEWFSLWKRSLALGKELGLEVHIYDENSYPSGFSGGHVPALAPDTAGRVLLYDWRDSTDGLPWMDKATVAVYAVEKREDGAPRAYRRIVQGDTASAGERVLVTRIAPVPAAEWTAGFPYVDLTDPRTTEVFLQTTYERYRREVGDEFGRTVLWAFSDEPELSKSQGWDGPGLPLSLRTLAEFRKRRGYDLADHLPSLHWDAGDFRRVRFDYWETIHELLAEAFFQPMFAWCDRNQLQWTGHWWEHLWPEPWSTPSDMSMNAFEHVPGIDLLAFQTDGLRARGVEPHMLLTVKQVASVAHQLGRPRVMSETYGGGGWGLGLEDMKRLGDWEIVHGVNLVIPHLAHATVRGPRKRDWPQSFSDAAEWWKDYRVHADHVGRLSLAMASGRAISRVLVLNPSTAAYLVARRSEASGANPDLERIKASQGQLLQRLADHQVDFDLGDEYLLDWFGAVEGPRLRVGRALYHVVVWPASMDNLRQATLDRLGAYARSGGAIVALGDPATMFVDGRPSEAARALVSRVARVGTGEELLGVLRRLAPPRVRFETEVPPGVGFAERELDGGDRLLLFNNAGQETVETVAVVAGTGRVEAWDTVSGAVDTYPVPARGREGLRARGAGHARDRPVARAGAALRVGVGRVHGRGHAPAGDGRVARRARPLGRRAGRGARRRAARGGARLASVVDRGRGDAGTPRGDGPRGRHAPQRLRPLPRPASRAARRVAGALAPVRRAEAAARGRVRRRRVRPLRAADPHRRRVVAQSQARAGRGPSPARPGLRSRHGAAGAGGPDRRQRRRKLLQVSVRVERNDVHVRRGERRRVGGSRGLLVEDDAIPGRALHARPYVETLPEARRRAKPDPHLVNDEAMAPRGDVAHRVARPIEDLRAGPLEEAEVVRVVDEPLSVRVLEVDADGQQVLAGPGHAQDGNRGERREPARAA
jgi:hypothetical protein